MQVTVRIPTQLRSLTDGVAEVVTSGDTVGEVLGNLANSYTGLSERLFDDSGSLRRFVNVFLADEDVRFLEGLDTKVLSTQIISIVPAVAGGAS